MTTKLSDIVTPAPRATFKDKADIVGQTIVITSIVEKDTPAELSRPGYETSVKIFYHFPKSKTLYFFTTASPGIVDPLLEAGSGHFPLEAMINFERVERDHNTYAKWSIS